MLPVQVRTEVVLHGLLPSHVQKNTNCMHDLYRSLDIVLNLLQSILEGGDQLPGDSRMLVGRKLQSSKSSGVHKRFRIHHRFLIAKMLESPTIFPCLG